MFEEKNRNLNDVNIVYTCIEGISNKRFIIS